MKQSYSLFIFLMVGVLSVPTQAQIDYETQIEPIFHNNCLSCHSPSRGVDFSSYTTLLNSVGNNYGSNLIVPGNPNASGIVDKIENQNPQFGNRMPTGGQLAQSEIDLIRQWISEGANEVATSNEIDSNLPTSFKLLGNYPNPFNPTTQIQFELPQSAQYTVSIFSVHGKLLIENVGFAAAGTASVAVDLTTNPTGVYFYQVTAVANGQTFLVGTGRMTLIK